MAKQEGHNSETHVELAKQFCSVRFLRHRCACNYVVAGVVPGTLGAQDAPAAQPPVAYASVSELNVILEQLKATADKMQSDLTKTRIEKWKTDASTKQQTLSNVESIQRNLKSALPETIAQLNNSPEDVGTSFKLYRNIDALYDVFGSVVESAGAFGPKEEYQNLWE